MIGLDTNTLVRYLAQDDPLQSPIANEVMERRLTASSPGFVTLVAIVETAWVLESVYHLGTNRLAAVLERLLQSDRLVIEAEQEVFTAVIALRRGQGSFADALIAALGRRAGCAKTLTFDRKALRIPGFELA